MKSRIILIMLIMFLFFGCAKKEEAAQVGSSAIPVRVERVMLQDLDKPLEYVGSIKAQDEVLVYPKVSGKIIEKIKEEGIAVNKGETIAYIDRDEVGLKFVKAPVESPVSGVVGRVYVDIGAHVTQEDPVALVVNMDQVKINLDIPEIYLPKIFLAQEAEITSDTYPQKKFIGRVTKISPVVNLENRAAPVEIILDNPQYLLKSGMFVKVSLVIEKRPNAKVILKEAIIGKGQDSYVYIIENNKAVRRKISLGIHSGPLYEVTEGLKEEDMVVVMGQQRLYDDAPVIMEIGDAK